MIDPQSAPVILLICLLATALGGLILLAWGKRLPRQGDWLVSSNLLFLLVGLIFAGQVLVDGGLKPRIWMRGWIWLPDGTGAITAGILQDGVGLIMAVLAVLISLLVVAGKPLLRGHSRTDRLHSAIALSTSGVCLCWISLTPWLAFIGLSLTILGGFTSLGGAWRADEEARLAIRFVWERTGGLLMAIAGACGLAVSRTALLWLGSAGEATHWIDSTQALGIADWIGAALLILGLLVHLQPFPLLGWAVSPSRSSPWTKILFTQIFPAWAAFSFLLRSEPNLRPLGVFPVIGWFLLGSAVLAAFSGLFQADWRTGLASWVSSGMTFSAAALAFTGPQAALALLIGFSLGSMAFAGAATEMFSAKEQTAPSSAGAGGGARAAKIACILGICAGTGFIGFVSAGGGLQWIFHAWDQPVLVAVSLPVFFLFAVLGWKLLWDAIRGSHGARSSYTSMVSPFLFIALALGMVWTGSISGNALPSGVDQVFPSLFNGIFGAATVAAPIDESTYFAVSGVFWAALFLAIAAAYWASLKFRAPQHPVGKVPLMQRLIHFVANGYGVDGAASHGMAGVTWFADRTQWLLDQKVWRHWIPTALGTVTHRVADGISTLDAGVSRYSRRMASSLVETPAKFLQIVQSGDVQWYLFFAVGSGLAILVHFMKF